MLTHTQKIKKMYEDIQKKLFYMIPEKWEKLFLYASVMDQESEKNGKGELFFYYIPKGLFRKRPVNVYEIPAKFNLDEKEYLKLVEVLYQQIKKLREEIRKVDFGRTWSNVTMKIEGIRFHVEYDYSNLEESEFNSLERHIIWRYEYLGIGIQQVNRKEKEVLEKYLLGTKILRRRERYDSGIYIKNVKNIVDYDTENYQNEQNLEYLTMRTQRARKNQILLSEEEMKNNN